MQMMERLILTDSSSLTSPPTTTDPSTWSYDVANRLLTRPGVTYTYDNNGNTLTKTYLKIKKGHGDAAIISMWGLAILNNRPFMADG